MSVNKVILLGRLGQDPELRYTPNQTPVCSFSLATSERRKGTDGEWGEQTEWHNIITFGKTAENCNQYLKKGRMAFVDGRIQTRKWQDKEGRDRYTTEIIANSVQFISTGAGKNEGLEVERNYSSAKKATPDAAPFAGAGAGEAVSFDDDDIPF